MKQVSCILLASLALASCGKSEPGKETIIREIETQKAPSTTNETSSTQTIEKEEAIFKVTRQTEIADDLSNYKEFVTDLNKFSISAEIKNLRSRSAKLICKEINPTVIKEELSAYVDEGSSKAKIKLEISSDAANQTDYNCRVLTDDKEVLAQTKIKIRKDYLVGSGTKTAKSLGLVDGTNRIGALILEERAALITEGMNLNIQASEFIALEGAVIESFKNEDLSSPDNSIGRSGGVINLNANKSLGKLTVHMRGKNGGTNTTVDNSYEQFTTASIDRCPNYNESETVAVWGGMNNPAAEKNVPRGSLSYTFNTKGADGMKGGDSGSFFLNTVFSSIELNVIKKVGEGGKGGTSVNPASSLTIQFFKAENHPYWGAGQLKKPRDFIAIYGGTDYSDKCAAIIRYVKQANLVTGAEGKPGLEGFPLPSSITIKETNESYNY